MTLTDKGRDYREWATLIFSFLAIGVFPIGAIVLKNERLEIKAETAELYVPKKAYEAAWVEHKDWATGERERLARQDEENKRELIRAKETADLKFEKFEVKMDAFSAKIDAVIIRQATMGEQLTEYLQRQDKKP